MPLSAIDKAQAINYGIKSVVPTNAGPRETPEQINYRGAIAEIGAGQEVARYFFEAMATSNTIEKTMSAYGKACSDAIYGKSEKYVTEERLKQMISYDYQLLLKRTLYDKIKEKNPRRYFTFANTVDTRKDGWAGVRVQFDGDMRTLEKASHTAYEYRIHFNLIGNDKVTMIRTVGALGINLIYAALMHASGRFQWNGEFVSSLMDHIAPTGLRIDNISVHKYELKVGAVSRGGPKIGIHSLEREKHGHISRDLCIELVKTTAVLCASFDAKGRAATPIYFAFRHETPYLVLTRSTCNITNVSMETAMLNAAKRRFAIDLGRELRKEINPRDIPTAIQLPILSISDTSHSDLYVWGTRFAEPNENRRLRTALIQSVPTEDIARYVDMIVQSKSVALLSEFSATSEMVKYLREKTRLRLPERKTRMSTLCSFLSSSQLTPEHRRQACDAINRVLGQKLISIEGEEIQGAGELLMNAVFKKYLHVTNRFESFLEDLQSKEGALPESNPLKTYRPAKFSEKEAPLNIALVLRADQFVEFLINVQQRVTDRNALEIVGNLIRRRTRIYIYPCEYQLILTEKTHYGADLKEALSDDGVRNNEHHPRHLVTVDQLKSDLKPEHAAVISYLASARAIADVDPLKGNAKYTEERRKALAEG